MNREHYSFSMTYRRVPLVAYGTVTWVDRSPVFEADRIETATGQENLYWMLDGDQLDEINRHGTQKVIDEHAEAGRQIAAAMGRSINV